VVWWGQESKQVWDWILSNHVLAISRRRTREEKEEKGRQVNHNHQRQKQGNEIRTLGVGNSVVRG
jgi:hypothetical protein